MNSQLMDVTGELRTLVDAINVVGSKGEVKNVQWITTEYDKTTLSYGNFNSQKFCWKQNSLKLILHDIYNKG